MDYADRRGECVIGVAAEVNHPHLATERAVSCGTRRANRMGLHSRPGVTGRGWPAPIECAVSSATRRASRMTLHSRRALQRVEDALEELARLLLLRVADHLGR